MEGIFEDMMKKRGRHGRITRGSLSAAVFALAFMLLSGAASAAHAAGMSDQPTPVRVGFFQNGDFMHKAEDGSYAGYDVEYYYTLAGYADWEIQFVEYGNLNEALAALESGEVDVMSGLSKTEERVNQYLISSKKMCTAQIAVQTRADDDRFGVGDILSMKDMTCGILKGSNVVTLYSDWCKENGLTPHIREYGSLDERNAALFAKEVDAIAGGSTLVGAQKIAEFPSLDLYFMFHRGRADLKAQMDQAMGILSLENPSYAANLFAKYFPTSRNSAPSFSQKEKAYLAAHPEIRVGILVKDAPFSNRGADGTMEGILPDYFQHLSQVVGADFVCEPFQDTAEAVTALRAGQIDLIGKFENDAFYANECSVVLTVPYLQMNMVQVVRAGTNTVQSFAVPLCNSEYTKEILAEQNPGASVQVCSDSTECFGLLKRGKADAMICTQPAATWLLNRNRSSDYTVLAFGSGTWDIVCALPYGETSGTLRAILDKAVTTDKNYINQLITGETLQDSSDLSTVLDRLPVSFLTAAVVVTAVLLCAAIAALVVLIRRRKVERQIAQRQAALAAAEDANQAKHAFFGSVSHDMRTPLNGIMGYTSLARASTDMEKVQDYLGKIQKSGSVLCALVDDTLVMSRMESGKYRLNPTPVNTSELLGEVLEPVRILAAEKGVRFEEKIAAPRPRVVLADRVSLQKVLLNLLTNAIHFTPPGGTVTFGCELDPPAGGEPDSIITVCDTGPGIGKDFLPKLFEPFAQEYPENADASGSGMELAIAKRLLDAMGAAIDVDSEKGKGTKFTVRIHLKPLGASSEPQKAEDDREALRGKQALVCEDSPLNLEIISTILTSFGMVVTGAQNGKAGVEAFAASETGRFDVVLMDLRMPVMDGVSAAYAIRALDRPDAKSVPILAVSADAFAEDVEKCRAAGMNGHVAKPIDPSSLCHSLVACMGKTA
jgi:signal transduction histidine kinase